MLPSASRLCRLGRRRPVRAGKHRGSTALESGAARRGQPGTRLEEAAKAGLEVCSVDIVRGEELHERIKRIADEAAALGRPHPLPPLVFLRLRRHEDEAVDEHGHADGQQRPVDQEDVGGEEGHSRPVHDPIVGAEGEELDEGVARGDAEKGDEGRVEGADGRRGLLAEVGHADDGICPSSAQRPAQTKKRQIIATQRAL